MILTTPIPSTGYERFFAFGCSFTNYHWVTWADIIARHMNIPSYNYGSQGTPIVHTVDALWQANKLYRFTDKDLIIVQWTMLGRSPKFNNTDFIWQTAKEFDIRNVVKNGKNISEAMSLIVMMAICKDAYNFFHFSMGNNNEYLRQFMTATHRGTKGELKKQFHHIQQRYGDILNCPNMHESILNDDWNYNFENYGVFDSHPLPEDHLKFVEAVLGLKINDEIVQKVKENHQWVVSNASIINKADYRNHTAIHEHESNLYFKNFYEDKDIKMDYFIQKI